jgi:early secretory antigenic target protein ESAT-6
MGNTGSIRVQYAGLDAASSDIGTSAAALRGHVEQMETALQPLVATWTGEAAAFYQERQREWDAAMVELGDILTRVGVAVRTARENYEEVERRNTRAWT